MAEQASSRRWPWVGLGLYALTAALILLAPVSYSVIVDEIWNGLHDCLGVTFGSGWIEFAANVVLFVPMGFFLTMLFRHPWYGAALSVVVSAGIEIIQILIPNRVPTVRDVVSNSIGAALGALLAWLIVLRREHKRARAAASTP